MGLALTPYHARPVRNVGCCDARLGGVCGYLSDGGVARGFDAARWLGGYQHEAAIARATATLEIGGLHSGAAAASRRESHGRVDADRALPAHALDRGA